LRPIYAGSKHGGRAAMRRISNGAADPAGLPAKKYLAFAKKIA
jgi:hypothetical protein